jgi:hypothetical protein
MSRPQTTEFDRKNPRTGVREDAPHLRTFADNQEANDASLRTLTAIEEIAKAEGVRVVAYCIAEHRHEGDLQDMVSHLINAKGRDLIAAHQNLGSHPEVIRHGFARLAEALFADDNKKG